MEVNLKVYMWYKKEGSEFVECCSTTFYTKTEL